MKRKIVPLTVFTIIAVLTTFYAITHKTFVGFVFGLFLAFSFLGFYLEQQKN